MGRKSSMVPWLINNFLPFYGDERVAINETINVGIRRFCIKGKVSLVVRVYPL